MTLKLVGRKFAKHFGFHKFGAMAEKARSPLSFSLVLGLVLGTCNISRSTDLRALDGT